MPIVENDTEEEIEYRVNDEGRDKEICCKIEGSGTGTIDYKGKRYHRIEWLLDNTLESQWVPSNENAKKYLSNVTVIIHEDRRVTVKTPEDTNPHTGKVHIENRSEHAILYCATKKAPIFKIGAGKDKSFTHEGPKFHQIRWNPFEEFTNVADRRLPSEIEVIIHPGRIITTVPPIGSLPGPAEAAETTSAGF